MNHFIFFSLVWSGAPLPFPAQPDIKLYIYASADYRGKVFFFSPHENESVANDYLMQQVRKRGGRYAVLRQAGRRHVTLRIDDHEIEVDPNRIFTPVGAAASVRKLNPALSNNQLIMKKAKRRAFALGTFILKHIAPVQKGTVLVAVHNNTDGYDDDGKGGVGTVSMQRYQKKLDAGAKYILKIHHGKGDEDDLFFINRQEDFDALKAQNWNVVLQHPRVATLPDEDDGSLSVLAEMKGYRYFNIEAQRKNDQGIGENHLAVQKQMIDVVFDLVSL